MYNFNLKSMASDASLHVSGYGAYTFGITRILIYVRFVRPVPHLSYTDLSVSHPLRELDAVPIQFVVYVVRIWKVRFMKRGADCLMLGVSCRVAFPFEVHLWF